MKISHSKLFLLVLLLFSSYSGYTQTERLSDALSPKADDEEMEPERRGFRWGFGFSIGNSSHADSYFIDQFGSNREYPGLRLYNFDARVGWEFHKRIGIYSIIKFSPANTTVSPYRSSYYGGYLTYYLTNDPRYFVFAGAGKYNSKISKDETTGDGVLMNFGVGVELRQQILVELNVLTGAMDHGNVTPDPFIDREVNISLGAAFLF